MQHIQTVGESGDRVRGSRVEPVSGSNLNLKDTEKKQTESEPHPKVASEHHSIPGSCCSQTSGKHKRTDKKVENQPSLSQKPAVGKDEHHNSSSQPDQESQQYFRSQKDRQDNRENRK